MADLTNIERLNSVKYLCLREISEADKSAFNTLRIVVEEAVENLGGTISPTVLERPELKGLLTGAHPIESVEGCKLFQIDWKAGGPPIVTNPGRCPTSAVVSRCGHHEP